ncbi:MAG: flippase-like domain-containing protein [Magnetospirillum sp.]|nr:flippase-like domain-containing protein [Magnetospirillum sp.]
MLKRWFPWALKGGLSVGLIWWALKDVDVAAGWEQLKGIDPAMLAAAVALGFLQIVVGAVRWHSVLLALKTLMKLSHSSRLYYVSCFFSIVLPGAVGADAVRMWLARREGMELSSAINSVMLERVATVFALFILVAVTQPMLLARVPDIPGTWVFPLLTAAGLFGILLLTVLDRLPERLRHMRLVRGLAHLAADTRRLFFRPRWATTTMAIAIFGHINLAMMVWVLARGMQIELSLLDCLVLVPPVILLMTLPISIAGWGVRETAMQTFLGFVGVANHSSVVISVVFGLLLTLAALPGGLVWLTLGGNKVRLADVEAEEAAAEKEAGTA